MKIKVPAKTVEACDICERQSVGCLLTKCVVCSKNFCHTCEAIMAGCIHQPHLCRRCGKIESVRNIVNKFAPKLLSVLDRRDEELRKAVNES